MGFLKLYRPLLFYLCALVCRKCCREFNGQLYGEPVRLEWNKPRLRKENCWPCTSWTLLGPTRYRVNDGCEHGMLTWDPVSGSAWERNTVSKNADKGCTRTRRDAPKQRSVRSGHLQLSGVDRAERRPGGSSPARSLLTPMIPATEVRDPIPTCDPCAKMTIEVFHSN